MSELSHFDVAELTTLAQLNPDLLCVMHGDGRLIKVNPAFITTMGYAEREIPCLSLFDLSHPDDRDVTQAAFRKQIRNGGIEGLEQHCRCKDGSYRRLRWHALYQQESDRIYATARDIGRYESIPETIAGIQREQERYYLFAQYAFDNGVDGIFISNNQADIVYVNRKGCQSLGYSFDELKSMTLFDINPRLKTETWEKDIKLARDGLTSSIETFHKRKDGSLIPIEVNFNVLYFEDSEYFCAFVRDIEERKNATRQMEELRLAVENAADAIYLYNSNAEIYYANQSACETLGYSAAELIGLTLADIDPHFSLENHRKLWNQTSENKLTGVERTHRKKNGAIYPVEINVMQSDFDGNKYATAIVRDISERKLAARRTEELRFAVDNAVDAIYLNDKDGNIHYANQSACNLLGYSQQELTSMNIAEIDSEFSSDLLKTLIDSGDDVSGDPPDIFHRKKDGSIFPVEVNFNSRAFEGVEYFCSFARDITERKAAERQLRQFRYIVENAIDAVYLTNTTGDIEYVNNSGCQALGYSYDELIDMNIAEIDMQLNRNILSSHVRNSPDNKNGAFETLHQKKDGTEFPVEVMFNNTSFDGIEYSFAFARDITDRKQALREMEQLRFAIDNAVDAIYLLNKDAEIFYANRHACEYLGYSYDELTSITVFDLDPYVTRELWEATWEAAHAGQLGAIESHHKKKDGSTFPVEISVSNSLYDGFAYSCTFARNITARKEVEKKLLFTQFAIDKAGDAIFFTNAHGHIMYANETAVQQLGFSQDELTQMTVRNIDPNLSDGNLDSDELWQRLVNDNLSSIESTHISKDGSSFPVEINATILDFEGEKFSCSVVRDITERVQTQNELQKHREHLEELVRDRTIELESAQEELLRKERLAVLGQLTGVVGHELRNPLGTITASLYLIRNKMDTPNEDVERSLARVERNIVRCDKIIDELLDYTRARPLELESINFDNWIATIIGEFQNPVQVSIKMDLRSNAIIEIEPDRFRRCIINGLSNACEATQENSTGSTGKVIVSTYIEDRDVVVDIDDSGKGIPDDKLKKIFEPLYSTKGFGVGLGLSIVEQIMAQHGGVVNLTSIAGKGARMSLRLPLQRQNSLQL